MYVFLYLCASLSVVISRAHRREPLVFIIDFIVLYMYTAEHVQLGQNQDNFYYHSVLYHVRTSCFGRIALIYI